MASELAGPGAWSGTCGPATPTGRTWELTHRAAGDLPNLSDAHTAPPRDWGETDARLRHIERGL